MVDEGSQFEEETKGVEEEEGEEVAVDCWSLLLSNKVTERHLMGGGGNRGQQQRQNKFRIIQK